MSRIKVEEEEEKEIDISSLIDEDVEEDVSFKRWQLCCILGLGILIGFLIGVLIYG